MVPFSEVATMEYANYDDMVKKLTGGYSPDELCAAFNLVKNPNHWKDPISGDVKAELKEVVAAAIEFYTATVAEFSPSSFAGYVHVKAAGYRAGPAGDH
jgi:hypothetical protein